MSYSKDIDDAMTFPKALTQDEETRLAHDLLKQIEFYFSAENLSKDTFLLATLRQHNGAVPLRIIANFPRVREIFASGHARNHIPGRIAPVADAHFLAFALQSSVTLQVHNEYIIPSNTYYRPRPSTGVHTDATHHMYTNVKVIVDNVPAHIFKWKEVADVFTTRRVKPVYVQPKGDGVPGEWVVDFRDLGSAVEAMNQAYIFAFGSQPIRFRLEESTPLPPQYPSGYYHGYAAHTQPPMTRFRVIDGYPAPQPLPPALQEYYTQHQLQRYTRSPISWNYPADDNASTTDGDVTSSYVDESHRLYDDEEFPPLSTIEGEKKESEKATPDRLNELVKDLEETHVSSQESSSEPKDEAPPKTPYAPKKSKGTKKQYHKKKFHRAAQNSSPASFSKDNGWNKKEDVPELPRSNAEVVTLGGGMTNE